LAEQLLHGWRQPKQMEPFK
jgi:hypothetical protein